MFRYNFGNNLADFGKFLGIFTIVFIVGIIAQLMIALAVNEDCKAIGVKNRTLWAVLTFFIPLAGVIYLIVRSNLEKTVPKFCPRCGASSAPNARICQCCGNTVLMDYRVTDAPVHQKKRKNFLTWGVILYVVYLVVYMVGFGTLFGTIFKRATGGSNRNGSGYYDFNPDFGSGLNDYDDFFDEFNNFGSGN